MQMNGLAMTTTTLYEVNRGEMALATSANGSELEIVICNERLPTTKLSLIMTAIYHRLSNEDDFSREMLAYAASHREEIEDIFGMKIDDNALRVELQGN